MRGRETKPGAALRSRPAVGTDRRRRLFQPGVGQHQLVDRFRLGLEQALLDHDVDQPLQPLAVDLAVGVVDVRRPEIEGRGLLRQRRRRPGVLGEDRGRFLAVP